MKDPRGVSFDSLLGAWANKQFTKSHGKSIRRIKQIKARCDYENILKLRSLDTAKKTWTKYYMHDMFIALWPTSWLKNKDEKICKPSDQKGQKLRKDLQKYVFQDYFLLWSQLMCFNKKDFKQKKTITKKKKYYRIICFLLPTLLRIFIIVDY